MNLNTHELAFELMEARAAGHPVEIPPSRRDENFDLTTAYTVEREIFSEVQARGRTMSGRKIGFTNRAVWPRLGLDTIVWGRMFDNTIHPASSNQAVFWLSKLVAPKIEPEIVFKLSGSITPQMSETQALAAIEWFALGFEIVDSPYPGWSFKVPDMVAAFGFHTGLVVGEPQTISDAARLAEELANFKLMLAKNGQTVAEGTGSNVFGSPLQCLIELAGVLAQNGAEPLAAGEIITSGTITDAQYIAPQEEWSAAVTGLAVPALTLRFETSEQA